MQRYRVERLSNGLIAVWDYGCQWQAVYTASGEYRWGGADREEYRQAIAKFLGK